MGSNLGKPQTGEKQNQNGAESTQMKPEELDVGTTCENRDVAILEPHNKLKIFKKKTHNHAARNLPLPHRRKDLGVS